MGTLLKWLINKLFKRKRRRLDQPANQVPQYATAKAGYPFCLFAILLFGLQGFVATAGSLDVVFPDLPSPISFKDGRAIHLNLSLIWPLLGVIGGIYYFFPQETGRELYSYRLAWGQFWLTALVSLAILVTLAFGMNEGREYFEAWWPLRAGLVGTIVLLFYNLVRTYLAPGVPKFRPTLISILLGIGSLIPLYLPNLFSYSHQTHDDLVRFWVVHLWEEMGLELAGTAVTVALLLSITKLRRETLEAIIYLELALVFMTGFLSTGHHYYWIGLPGYWILVGIIFSAGQLLPILLLSFATIKTYLATGFQGMEINGRLALAFLGASVFYHVIGAGLMGFVMAVPGINRWLHGTYLTSAHSHLALAGVFGFLVLGVCLYVLLQGQRVSTGERQWLWLSFFLLNGGMLVMGAGLTVAGFLQVYLWRMTGLDFSVVIDLMRPYLMVRALGGIIYAIGCTIMTWMVIRIGWRRVAH